MSRPPTITCLFFSDVSVPSFVASPAGRPLGGDVFVECGPSPALAFALNVETPANYPGVCGLLGGVDIGTLAHPTERLPAPLIFAPGSPVAAAAMRAAIALLTRPDERFLAITLLVPVGFAKELGAALGMADRFAIAWDAAAFPHDELAEFARWLAAEKLLSAENFAGLYPYANASVARAHSERIQELLAPVSGRVPAIGATLSSVR